jgi:hypothetical protein
MKKFHRGNKGKNRSNKLNNKVKLNLPKDYPWKVLGWLTNDLVDVLDSADKELLVQITRDRDSYALNLLMDDWGLQNVSIGLGIDTTHIAKIRAKYQLSALLKKYQFDTDKHMREASALETFRRAEAACEAFNHSGYDALCKTGTEKWASIFTYARSFVKKVLGTNSPSRDIVTLWSRHGPGSNLDTCQGQSNAYYKYGNWPYSCTSAALPYAKFLIQTDERWLGYLEDSYRERYDIPKHLILNQRLFWSKVFKLVEGNKIAFVPKNAQTERSIAIEPAMNLMLQLGVDGHIRKRLKRWDVDLDSQEKNQLFAYRGSVNPTLYSTLDLSMASDSLSLKLCELLLPWEWFNYLCKIRSPKGKIGDEVVNYHKISSMGNGYTFALESLIFTALIYGAIKQKTGDCDFRNDISVFGDDIIVRTEYVDLCIASLNRAGFQLNIDKSFISGYIKESCGSDWVQGKPVRPVFMKRLPTDLMELFVDINRLKRVLQLRWGVYESLTVKNMKRWIPLGMRGFVGPYSDTDFDSYIHTQLPTGSYKNWVWKYRRLIKQSTVVRNARNFLQRKLMHDLRGPNIRPKPGLFNSSRDPSRSRSGSRFTVYKSYSYAVRTTHSLSSEWRGHYVEVDPRDS